MEALTFRKWSYATASGPPPQGDYIYLRGTSWLFGDKCKTLSGNELPCPPGIPYTGPEIEMPSTIDGYTVQTYTTADNEVIYYTEEWTEAQARARLTAAGYDPEDSWFTSIDAQLNLCPEATITLTVTNPAAYAPPASDCSESAPMGIKSSFLEEAILLSPNPVSNHGVLNIQLGEDLEAVQRIVLIDAMGRKVKEIATPLKSRNIQINVENQIPGSYILYFQTAEILVTKKIWITE